MSGSKSLLSADCLDELGKVTVPFWSPTMQQHQWFLPTLPGTRRANASADTTKMKVLSDCLLSAFMKEHGQQVLCRLAAGRHSALASLNQLAIVPVACSLIAQKHLHWSGLLPHSGEVLEFRKTHWWREIFACENAWIYAGKEFCSEYRFLFSGLFKFVAAVTHKVDIFRTAKQSVIHHFCHQLLPDELCLLEEPPLLLMSEHIAWVRPIHLHSDDVFHTLY